MMDSKPQRYLKKATEQQSSSKSLFESIGVPDVSKLLEAVPFEKITGPKIIKSKFTSILQLLSTKKNIHIKPRKPTFASRFSKTKPTSKANPEMKLSPESGSIFNQDIWERSSQENKEQHYYLHTQSRDDVYAYLKNANFEGRTVLGWKFHVSIDENKLADAWSVINMILINNNVHCAKICTKEGVLSVNPRSKQSGKQLCVYVVEEDSDKTPQDWVNVLARIYLALLKKGIGVDSNMGKQVFKNKLFNNGKSSVSQISARNDCIRFEDDDFYWLVESVGAGDDCKYFAMNPNEPVNEESGEKPRYEINTAGISPDLLAKHSHNIGAIAPLIIEKGGAAKLGKLYTDESRPSFFEDPFTSLSLEGAIEALLSEFGVTLESNLVEEETSTTSFGNTPG